MTKQEMLENLLKEIFKNIEIVQEDEENEVFMFTTTIRNINFFKLQQELLEKEFVNDVFVYQGIHFSTCPECLKKTIEVGIDDKQK